MTLGNDIFRLIEHHQETIAIILILHLILCRLMA